MSTENPRPKARDGKEAGLRGVLQSHPRSRGERVTQERRDQKGTEVNEERLNRESGCDGRGRECRVSLLTAFASFTSRTARREGNRMMNVEREARQAKEGSKVGCISQPFTAPWFGCPLPAPVSVRRSLSVVPSVPRLSRFTLVPRSVRHSLRSLGRAAGAYGESKERGQTRRENLGSRDTNGDDDCLGTASRFFTSFPAPSRYPFPTVVGRSPVPAGRHDGRGNGRG